MVLVGTLKSEIPFLFISFSLSTTMLLKFRCSLETPEIKKYSGIDDEKLIVMIFCMHLSMSKLKNCFVVVVVQLLSNVQFIATPWTAAHQPSLSFAIIQSLLKLMSIELPSPSLPAFYLSQHQGLFQ